MKINALRTVYMEQNDIDSIGQQDKKTNIYKTAGIEAVDTEKKDENVSHQKDATGLMGEIHSIHYNNDADTHLDARQTGIGHFQIHARAEEYIQKNVNNENADERSGNGLPFRESGQIGEIIKRKGNGVGGKCHEKTADAQRLLPIVLGDDGKMADGIQKSGMC